ncbi:MAG: SAM-dependent methyltransferase, partial [Burkholderiaceae bacterium]|nr:SAM-dependent methyltransferase [Burkholderiaceae bacterium]
MHAALETASPWIAQYADLIVPGGKVLDLACGGGRHA